jgi:hypothetical protein
VENKKECKEHCWHDGSGFDSLSMNGDGSGEAVVNYKCCWCGETKTETQKWGGRVEKPHGSKTWIH